MNILLAKILRASAIAVILLNGCVSTSTSPSEPRSRYVTNANQRVVLVFVHGVFGDATSTWTNSTTNAYFPNLVARDPAFKGMDVYVYEYSTPFRGGTFRINELAENMRLVLSRDDVLNRDEVIFVAHSMGGLLIPAFILKNREVAQRVRYMYLFSTPTAGSEIARIGRLFSPNPQVGQMAKVDPSLEDLRRDWLAANFGIPTYRAYEKRPTFGRIIVEQDSALGLCNRRVDPIDTNHLDIVKPASPSDTPYAALVGAFRDAPSRTREGPDVTLRLVYPGEPALLLINQSGAIARDIKWTVTLWNLDLPERTNPLPIPVSTFDWIRPRQTGGPQNLFGAPAVKSLLSSGNRLIGSASVVCPDCTRGRTFVIYIVWGQGGWFTEVVDRKDGEILIPNRFTKTLISQYAKELLSLIPESARIPISEP
jgi:pimeloyl-ACP methyl ester carboxylesterase